MIMQHVRYIENNYNIPCWIRRIKVKVWIPPVRYCVHFWRHSQLAWWKNIKKSGNQPLWCMGNNRVFSISSQYQEPLKLELKSHLMENFPARQPDSSTKKRGGIPHACTAVPVGWESWMSHSALKEKFSSTGRYCLASQSGGGIYKYDHYS